MSRENRREFFCLTCRATVGNLAMVLPYLNTIGLEVTWHEFAKSTPNRATRGKRA